MLAPARDGQAVDAKSPGAHGRDVQVDFVVIGGIGTYMKAEIDGIVQVGKRFYFQFHLIVGINIRCHCLDFRTVVTLDG